jgi:hypothetical protein
VLVHVHDMPDSLMKSHPRGALEFLLPMVLGHVEAQRQHLSRAEQDRILSHRFGVVGSDLYRAGHMVQAIRFFLRAIRHGARPDMVVAFMVRESIPVQWLKSLLRPLKAAL